MHKAFKYRMYPRKKVQAALEWTLEQCRLLYNAALTERRDAYNFHVKQHPNYYDLETHQRLTRELTVSYQSQQNDLPEMKEDLAPEYQRIAAHVLQDVLHRLDKAFSGFYARVQKGQAPGYPRFKGKGRYDSITYPDKAGWKFDGRYLHLSKLGPARVRLHRPIEGKIKTVTIKREVDQWYVIFTCEVSEPAKLLLSYEDVGIDLGISHLATLSNGEMIEHPRYYRKGADTLKKAQQKLAKKQKGSHRREKAKQKVGRAHRKIRNQRRDFLQKVSHSLIQRYQIIVFEDIQTKNLSKKPKPKQDENGKYLPNGAAAKGGLNQSIADASWGLFVDLCSSKAANAGRTLIKVDPKYTSQICSQCGTVKKKDLSERWHSCDCGADLDRDVNAAINILARGLKQLSGGTRPTPGV